MACEQQLPAIGAAVQAPVAAGGLRAACERRVASCAPAACSLSNCAVPAVRIGSAPESAHWTSHTSHSSSARHGLSMGFSTAVRSSSLSASGAYGCVGACGGNGACPAGTGSPLRTLVSTFASRLHAMLMRRVPDVPAARPVVGSTPESCTPGSEQACKTANVRTKQIGVPPEPEHRLLRNGVR